MMSLVMRNGETVIFSVQARDFAGNLATAISPPLTIDTTPPVISDLSCTKYLSKARSQLTCQWETTVDEESSLHSVRIGLGTEQQADNMLAFYHVKLTERTWQTMIAEHVFESFSGTAVVSLLVMNAVQEESGAYLEVLSSSQMLV